MIFNNGFPPETIEERLDLNIFMGQMACQMVVQKLEQLLFELLSHRLARINI